MSDRALIERLLLEYDRSLDHTGRLWHDLSTDEVNWRPNENSSAIGWHLGHQAAVAHYMVRNLTAAEPSPDPALDDLMDSATPEPHRGALPDLQRLARYRDTVAERVRFRLGKIAGGQVGAPAQLALVGATLLVALVNHEYQHSQWIAEVRRDDLAKALPPSPESDLLTTVDGYTMLHPRVLA